MKIESEVSMDYMPGFSKVTLKLSDDNYKTSFTSLMGLEGLKNLLNELMDIYEQINDTKEHILKQEVRNDVK